MKTWLMCLIAAVLLINVFFAALYIILSAYAWFGWYLLGNSTLICYLACTYKERSVEEKGTNGTI